MLGHLGNDAKPWFLADIMELTRYRISNDASQGIGAAAQSSATKEFNMGVLQV